MAAEAEQWRQAKKARASDPLTDDPVNLCPYCHRTFQAQTCSTSHLCSHGQTRTHNPWMTEVVPVASQWMNTIMADRETDTCNEQETFMLLSSNINASTLFTWVILGDVIKKKSWRSQWSLHKFQLNILYVFRDKMSQDLAYKTRTVEENGACWSIASLTVWHKRWDDATDQPVSYFTVMLATRIRNGTFVLPCNLKHDLTINSDLILKA